MKTRKLEEITSTNFNSFIGKRYIDTFIKSYKGGIFSLREDHLKQISLTYFKGNKRRTFYSFRHSPFSFTIIGDTLYFVGNNNEILYLELQDNVLEQDIEFNVLLPHQAVKIADPLSFDESLFITLGNTQKEVVKSLSGKFVYRLGNRVQDFTYVNDRLWILAESNTGYVIEVLTGQELTETIHVKTETSLRHIASFKNNIYLAGSKGVYILNGSKLELIQDLEVTRLTSNDECFLLETANNVYHFKENLSDFELFASQSGMVFTSKDNCFFVDNLTAKILDYNLEVVGTRKMHKGLLSHQNKIAHYTHVGESTHLIDIETGELIAKTKERILNLKIISTDDDIYYLGYDDLNASIAKLEINKL